MADNYLVKQVKKLIIGVIEKLAKENDGCNADEIKLCIAPKDSEGNPIIIVYKNSERVDIMDFKRFSGYISNAKKLIYNGMGFNVETDIEEWIKKFILKSASDNSMSINKSVYFLFINKKDLVATMFVGGKRFKVPAFMKHPKYDNCISIDYIMQTN